MQHSRTIRGGGALLALAAVLMWAPRLHAFGCQASGSLPIFPSDGTTCPTALQIGDLVDILVTVQNTSSSVPPGTNVTAKLVNVCVGGTNAGAACTVSGDCNSTVCGAAIVYTLACTNTTCSAELPGTLTFVPVGGNGCVSNDAAVTGCALDVNDVTNNTVNITVDAVGVPLPAGGNVSIATIRAQATAEVPFSILNPCGQFGTRADTFGNSIVTTDGQCSSVATGGAQGSSNLFLPQPTATPTPTPTVTATATPQPIDPQQCFEIHRPKLGTTVSLVDAFGPSTATIKNPKRICAPADMNGLDPTAPSRPGHQTYYTIKQTTPKFVQIKGVIVNDLFGSLTVNITRPDRLLVPTSKSLVGPPSPLVDALDHYKCYKVAGARFRQDDLNLVTQFGPIQVDIRKPLHLCAPVDKNGEGVVDAVTHLMCYQPKGPRPVTQPTIFTLNQFGQDSYIFYGPRDFCVPATIILP